MFKRILPITLFFVCVLTLSTLAGQADDKKQRAGNEPGKVAQSKKKSRSNRKARSISASLGKKLYKQYQCYDCHSIGGKGCENGFRLDNEGSKRTKAFIKEHLVDPDKHFDKHPDAFGTDLNLMPPQDLESWEIDSLVEYLYSLK